MGNLLVLQGGGPTPVLNASLFGVLDEARQQGRFDRIIGARYGVAGLLTDELLDLTSLPQQELERLKVTPGASLGSTRHKLSDADVEQIVEQLRRRDVRSLLLIGGNGSMRAADLIARGAVALGHEMSVIGIPKTIDNDIPLTDRCPGFGSAARYVAQSVRDLAMDVRSLPQPVSIYETMGRSTGWLAGASVLARAGEEDAPHLVYLPERPFDVEQFLGDLDRVVTKLGCAVVVVTEGLLNAAGQPIFESASAAQRDALNRPLPGGVCVQLAEVVSQRLGIRCRWEKPGLCGRASSLHVSPVDRADAERVGRAGVRAAAAGMNAQMIALRPLEGHGYDRADRDRSDHRTAREGAAGHGASCDGAACEGAPDEGRAGDDACELVPLANVAGGDRRVPAAWLDDTDASVTADFLRYARPVVGELVGYPAPLLNGPLSPIPTLQRQSV